MQIQHVPWRSRQELLQVRRWLFPLDSAYDSDGLDEEEDPVDGHGPSDLRWKHRRRACDVISAWKTRPPLPHAIESTWLLTEAILADDAASSAGSWEHGPLLSIFSIKAGYITALTRFVTALLDSAQTSKFKVSMYAKAVELGLPAMFVDLRHEATHGEMPSLVVLRAAAEKGLGWLRQYYWDGLDLDGQKLHGTGVGKRKLAEDCSGDVEPWQYSMDVL